MKKYFGLILFVIFATSNISGQDLLNKLLDDWKSTKEDVKNAHPKDIFFQEQQISPTIDMLTFKDSYMNTDVQMGYIFLKDSKLHGKTMSVAAMSEVEALKYLNMLKDNLDKKYGKSSKRINYMTEREPITKVFYNHKYVKSTKEKTMKRISYKWIINKNTTVEISEMANIVDLIQARK